jgi:hypothetical protein
MLSDTWQGKLMLIAKLLGTTEYYEKLDCPFPGFKNDRHRQVFQRQKISRHNRFVTVQ